MAFVWQLWFDSAQMFDWKTWKGAPLRGHKSNDQRRVFRRPFLPIWSCFQHLSDLGNFKVSIFSVGSDWKGDLSFALKRNLRRSVGTDPKKVPTDFGGWQSTLPALQNQRFARRNCHETAHRMDIWYIWEIYIYIYIYINLSVTKTDSRHWTSHVST